MNGEPMHNAERSNIRALSEAQLQQLIRLRHALHRHPEVSGQEHQTAARIAEELKQSGADRIWTDIGGHGVAAEFRGRRPDGPTIMLRCELDALPIEEHSDLSYRSAHPGIGHLCGHDGHMCMIMGAALALGLRRPARGRVVLLFQPAEETGAGAQAVIDDPHWADIRPDYAFAYHNVPGWPLGEVGLRTGTANCASRGMRIMLSGRSSHAAAPEDGVSPASVMAELIRTLPDLGSGKISDPDYALSTLTHVRLGEPAFGISPGDGEVYLTLRSTTDARMERLMTAVEQSLTAINQPIGIKVSWHDVFLAAINDDTAIEIARAATQSLGLPMRQMTHPMQWSEDFGRYAGEGVRASMLFLGAGVRQPQLHNPDYDFPDDLLPTGAGLLLRIIDDLLGG